MSDMHSIAGPQSGSRRTVRLRIACCVSVGLTVLLLAAAAGAQAQLVKTFPLPATLKYPDAIAAGPDGALWFTQYNHDGDGPVAGVLGRITTAGAATAVPIPATSKPVSLTNGPDGALWYAATTEARDPARLGRVAAEGVTEAQLPAGVRLADGVVTGPDRALWFTAGGRIGRLVPGAAPTFFTIKGAHFLDRIVVGPDGALWFTDFERPVLGRITTAGVSQIFRTPIKDRVDNPTDGIDELAAGTDGAVWFTSFRESVVGRITSSGRVRMYRVGGVPGTITAGSDGGMWFTDTFGLKRIGRDGEVTEIELPEDLEKITSQEGITSGPDGAIWFTQKIEDLESSADSGAVGRLDLPAMADKILVARLASTPVSARRNSTVRVAFTSTRSAPGVLTLDLGKREVLRRKIRANAGENTVTLRLPRRPGGYRLHLLLSAGQQTATHDRPLTVRP
jgi:virginiamycin B lyase